jgi:L-fuculose-phosphate aldolase
MEDENRASAATSGEDAFGTELRGEMVDYGRRMSQDRLVAGTAGNLSVRAGDEVLITPSNIPYDAVRPDLLCTVDIEGKKLAGPVEPSSETPLHTLIYRSTDAGAVVHTHSMYATTLACTVGELPAVHYAIHRFGASSIAVADYERFGSEELAAAVVSTLGKAHGVLLRNHGAVTYAATLEEAYDLAVLLEWLAELYWRTRVMAEPSILTAEQLEEVSTEARRRRYMQRPGSV